MSKSIKAKHSIESPYRALCTIIRFVIYDGFPAEFPDLTRGNAHDKIKKIYDENISDEDNMKKLIKLALNSLTQQQRTKTNIQNILLGSWSSFTKVLKKLNIQIPQINSQYFEEVQLAIREFICYNFSAEIDKIWEEYENIIEEKGDKNLPRLKKFIKILISKDKLIWKPGSRLPIKKMIQSALQDQQIQESPPQTGVQLSPLSKSKQICDKPVDQISEQEDESLSESRYGSIGVQNFNPFADSPISRFSKESFLLKFRSDNNQDSEQ